MTMAAFEVVTDSGTMPARFISSRSIFIRGGVTCDVRVPLRDEIALRSSATLISPNGFDTSPPSR